MMTFNRIAVPVLAFCLGIPGLSAVKAYGVPSGSPAQGYGQDRGGWDMPPQEWQEVQRRGFQDGIEGARRDMENHRMPNVNNRDEYRHPDVPSRDRRAYRNGFRRGYQQAMSHFMGGGPGQQMRGPDQGNWNMGPGPGSEIQQRGFQDGMEGARKDMDNHRRPDPNNRDEYRHPNVPYEMQEQYRDAFRRGYQQAMAQMGVRY